ncbi:phosphoribosylglycinamide formyltransferase [Vagococcus acidifermentans]|uniref:Phosphoribosylglycinamide formyltransferase n=1 Tax=Vagococcus acidifermentans TaxID=564710 RepID=A0A430AP18_9ENTE|nr:phosphoribosylglycinamide formyltransferase [Vagococcus acidifermentans]RSU09627.1 phosphoribosylglycinamide formyltransferase [Vagococcus acidifermentans]
MKIAVFASGNGSNFEAIAEAVETGEIQGEIVMLFSDQPDAYAIERAKRRDIPVISFSPKSCSSKTDYELRILHFLHGYQVELIVLAGYMRIIGETLLSSFPSRIINIHPSLLPAFPGKSGIQDAFKAGVAESGVTVHYVDQGIDTGPIIAQVRVPIHPNDTLAAFEERIHQAEHQLYPRVIQEIIQCRKEDRKS